MDALQPERSTLPPHWPEAPGQRALPCQQGAVRYYSMHFPVSMLFCLFNTCRILEYWILEPSWNGVHRLWKGTLAKSAIFGYHNVFQYQAAGLLSIRIDYSGNLYCTANLYCSGAIQEIRSKRINRPTTEQSDHIYPCQYLL